MKTEYKAWAVLQPEGHIAAYSSVSGGEHITQFDIYETRKDAEEICACWKKQDKPNADGFRVVGVEIRVIDGA